VKESVANTSDICKRLYIRLLMCQNYKRKKLFPSRTIDYLWPTFLHFNVLHCVLQCRDKKAALKYLKSQHARYREFSLINKTSTSVSHLPTVFSIAVMNCFIHCADGHIEVTLLVMEHSWCRLWQKYARKIKNKIISIYIHLMEKHFIHFNIITSHRHISHVLFFRCINSVALAFYPI